MTITSLWMDHDRQRTISLPSASHTFFYISVDQRPTKRAREGEEKERAGKKRRRNGAKLGGQTAMPDGWEARYDGDKQYFVDHNTKTTHWKLPAPKAAAVGQLDEGSQQAHAHGDRRSRSRSASAGASAQRCESRTGERGLEQKHGWQHHSSPQWGVNANMPQQHRCVGWHAGANQLSCV